MELGTSSLFPVLDKTEQAGGFEHRSRSLRASARNRLRFLATSVRSKASSVAKKSTRLLRRLLNASDVRIPIEQLRDIRHEAGNCYAAAVDPALISDAESFSGVIVYEDNRPLPKPHAHHDTIRRLGHGRFSHWRGQVYFATTDNTDPRTNGRVYTFAEAETIERYSPDDPTVRPPPSYATKGRADLVYGEAFRRCMEYLASTRMKGDILEFGTFQGYTARVLATLMEEYELPGG